MLEPSLLPLLTLSFYLCLLAPQFFSLNSQYLPPLFLICFSFTVFFLFSVSPLFCPCFTERKSFSIEAKTNFISLQTISYCLTKMKKMEMSSLIQ